MAKHSSRQRFSRRQAAKYISAHLPEHYTVHYLKKLDNDVRLVPELKFHHYTRVQLDRFINEMMPH